MNESKNFILFFASKKMGIRKLVVTISHNSQKILVQSNTPQKAALVVSLLQVKLPHNNLAARNRFFAGCQN
jgi:hypothetical protein